MGRPRKTKGGVRIDPKTGKAASGRPTVMTPEVLLKLEQAFSFDATSVEACMYAGCSQTAFSEYIKNNPEFAERRELLRSKPVLAARESVIKNMKNDGSLALKYLERKKKDEFSVRFETTGKDGSPLLKPEVEHTQEEIIAAAKNILENGKVKLIKPRTHSK